MKKVILILVLLLIPIKALAYSSSATSTILMDTTNNRIIYANNINDIRSVASISKIMTCIIAIESNKLNDEIVVGEEINDSYGSNIYISVGEKIRIIDLLYGLMLRSGNDASLAIANYIGGNVNNFVKMMNAKAKEIGMKNTTFNNPNGLDTYEGNYSTAYDMALLTSYAMKNDTYKKIVSTKKYTLKTNLNTYSWKNKNKLLYSYKYITGGKTGFTQIARRTLVSTATKNNINLVVVTLNDGNDFADHKSLYEEAFKEFKNYNILKKGYIDIVSEEYYSNVKYYLKDNFSYLLRKEDKNNIILKFEIEKKYNYKNNDCIGRVNVLFENKNIFSTNIYIEIKRKKIDVWSKIKGWLSD